MNHPQHANSPDAWTQAEEAISDLRAALQRHGITLPGLGIHLPAVTLGTPIINLGLVSADVALRLAAAINESPASSPS
jgi:hypothetical protein